MNEALLQLCGCCKSFGGLNVCDRIDMRLQRGELYALIGPNGAGKTTLLNLITGLSRMDQGRIVFNGQDITNMAVHKRMRLGMARSFQITSLFPALTARQHIELAIQRCQGSGYRFWSRTDRDQALIEAAEEILEEIGIQHRRHVPAASLSHGEQRLLEMGMALASNPQLLLLDEPMAGLGPGSSRNLTRLIGGLKQRYTILLVEHDMDAVFALADHITVLLEGRILAAGSPEAIRDNYRVQEAYLGKDALCP